MPGQPKQTRLQLHADYGEMLEWIQSWVEEYDLYGALETFPPQRLTPIEHDLRRGLGDESVRRVWLTSHLAKLPQPGEQRAIGGGTDCVTVLLNPLRGDVQREFLIGSRTAEPSIQKLTRSLLRELRQGLHYGARILRPNGQESLSPRHPHTVGAHQLAQSGVRMLALAGDNAYLFDDLRAT